MIAIDSEPTIRVGLITDVSKVALTLDGRVECVGREIPAGDYIVRREGSALKVEGPVSLEAASFLFRTVDPENARITLRDVSIGIDFHWERKESQTFQGAMRLVASAHGLTAINEIPIESYLVSVISSEMSASCPLDLLKAHAVVSRSWLLAQLLQGAQETSPATTGEGAEIIRWYNRESHADFDVCADDHCQRYQGISKAFSASVFDAIRATRGIVLTSDGEICDARYSKSCGGMTEVYKTAWDDREVPYLAARHDGEGEVSGLPLPLSDEDNAESWITGNPPAYCNTRSREVLSRILPGFDQETTDFYRWEVIYSQDEMREILNLRTGVDFGRVRALEPLARGESGRIKRLRIRGEKRTLIVGKELEIRRALSRSHLYSSALVVRTEPDAETGFPSRFRLIGAGWGHGVGLCQIGAAVMAERGHSHEAILDHYFRDTEFRRLY